MLCLISVENSYRFLQAYVDTDFLLHNPSRPQPQMSYLIYKTKILHLQHTLIACQLHPMRAGAQELLSVSDLYIIYHSFHGKLISKTQV